MALSASTVTIVKQSVPALKELGADIVQEFYRQLFKRYPQVKRHFNMDRQKGGSSKTAGIPSQVAALGAAILAYAENIDNIPVLLPTVERIAHKHVSRGVQSEHYDAVGECLLSALQAILKSAATQEFLDSWKEAYFFLADVFRSTETSLREKLAEQAGFDGMVDMTVTDINDRDNGVREISFVPVDVAVPKCAAGQYVAVGVKTREGEDMMCTARVNAEENERLMVRVGKSNEAAAVFLRESTKVGDVLKVSMPCGEDIAVAN